MTSQRGAVAGMHRLLVGITGALLLGACDDSGTGPGAQDPNLVSNGGFELEDAGAVAPAPLGWRTSGEEEQAVSFAWANDDSYRGARSVSVSTSSDSQGIFAFNWFQRIDDDFETEVAYRLSGWVRTESLQAPPFIVVQCVDSTLENHLCFETTQFAFPLLGTNDWTQVGVEFTVPAQTAVILVLAGITSDPGQRAWFDEISVLPS